MAITTYEGVVEKGTIRLKSNVRLPENMRVYVIVPESQARQEKPPRVLTPRLAHRRQVADFKMKVSQE
jgi:hypothetical protein